MKEGSFEWAIAQMEAGKICVSSTGLLYRWKEVLEYQSGRNADWKISYTRLSTHMNYVNWKIHEEPKKTLSDKKIGIFSNTLIDYKNNELKFQDDNIYFEKDISESIKEFQNHCESMMNKLNPGNMKTDLTKLATEIFGEELVK